MMDSNAEQLFRKLLEPITAIGDLFQVNLSTILDPFLNHLEDVLCKVKDGSKSSIGGEKEIDFVRAGYLITNATLLYAAKVDSLYKEVYSFIDKLRSGESNDQDNDEEVDPEKDLEVKLNSNKNPFCLLPISGLKKGPKVSRFCEFDPPLCDVFAKAQVSFMSMSETEKRRVNLFSTHNKSIVIGCKDDFLLNTCSFLDNGTAILDYDFLDIINVVIPPRNILTIDELPPTMPEDTEAASSRGQCYNPNQLEDQLVRNLEKKFCNENTENEAIVDYPCIDEGMEMDDPFTDYQVTQPSTGFIEDVRAGSAQPSVMGNFEIPDTCPTPQLNSSRGVLCEVQLDKTIIHKVNFKPDNVVVNLGTIAEQIKDQVVLRGSENFDNIKCRSFKDAYVEDNYLNEGNGKRNKHLMVPVIIQKKFQDFEKMKKERDRTVKRALEKQGESRKSLSYNEVIEYFRINGKGKSGTTPVELSLFDKDKLYDVCLRDKKEKVRSLRKKVIKECEKNMNAATNVPETIAECIDEPVVEECINNDMNSDYNDVDDGIPTIEDNILESLPIVDEHLLTQEDFDLVKVPEIEAINNAMNASRKRLSVECEHDFNSSRKDQLSSQIEGSSQFKGDRSRKLETYMNDSIIIQADEELPMLTYTEIIEKYNDKYWKNIDREVSESYKKVIDWDDFLKPHIKIEEERKHFDISKYSHQLIDKFNSVEEVISFSDMVKTCPRHMISRYFLSSLLLVNKGNFKTEKKDDVNSITYKLLKTDFDGSEE